MPLPPTDERTLQAVGARRRIAGRPAVADLVRTLRRLATEQAALVSIFDARSIAGEAHLLSAWAHLGRARSRGEPRLRDRGAELALYVAGDDQLPRALAKVGVQSDSDAFVVVAERPRTIPELLAAFEFEEDPTVYPRPFRPEVLHRLGIGTAERAAVPADRWDGLVLERVAMLDLGGA